MQPIQLKNNKGHYSDAICCQGMLFISGQLPLNEAGEVICADIEGQCREVLKRLDTILTAAQTTKDQVVQCRIYLADIADWDAVNQLYADYFGTHKPARIVVPCGTLHYGARIELEAVATTVTE